MCFMDGELKSIRNNNPFFCGARFVGVNKMAAIKFYDIDVASKNENE